MSSKTRKAAPRAKNATSSRAQTARAGGNVKGEPSTWPAWTDNFHWAPGADATPVAPARRRPAPTPAPTSAPTPAVPAQPRH